MKHKLYYTYTKYADSKKATQYSKDINSRNTALLMPLLFISFMALVFCFASVEEAIINNKWTTFYLSLIIGVITILITTYVITGVNYMIPARSDAYYLKCKGADKRVIKQIMQAGRTKAFSETAKALPYVIILLIGIYSAAFAYYWNPLCWIITGLDAIVLLILLKARRHKDNTSPKKSIADNNKTNISLNNQNQSPYQPAHSKVNEIREYKKLLDEGAITKEEYEAKKKQLLEL